TTVTTDSIGAARFTDLSITGTAGVRTLAFSAAALVGVTSTAIDVTVTTPPPPLPPSSTPSLIAISRDGGSAAGGSTVTLTGAAFDARASVRFGSSVASRVTLVNSSTLQVVVPAGPVDAVDVSVTQNGG